MMVERLLRPALLCCAAALTVNLSVFADEPAAPSAGEEAVVTVSAAVVQGNGEGTAEEAGAPAEAEAPVEAVEAEPLAEAQEIEEERPVGVVVGGTVNVRTGPSTGHDKIASVRSGKLVSIEGEEDGWYKVSFDGVTGYICGDYLRESADGFSSVGGQAAALAWEFLGTRYAWGGSSPAGFDCSGLTMYLYAQFGYSLPHTATGQYNSCGSYVAREQLQPGDLVFFSERGYAIGHVGIYVGEGVFIHASTRRVVTDELDSAYYSGRYVGAVRIGAEP